MLKLELPGVKSCVTLSCACAGPSAASLSSTELSFLLQERSFWGQGYATAAAARCPGTLNSQPSTAAVPEGLLREFTRKGDAFHDVVMIVLVRKKWPPAQPGG